jgi:hypothetical protein
LSCIFTNLEGFNPQYAEQCVYIILYNIIYLYNNGGKAINTLQCAGYTVNILGQKIKGSFQGTKLAIL